MAPCSVIYCEQGFNGIASALHISMKHLNRITVSISLHQFSLLVRSIREPAKGGIQNNSTPMHLCATNPAIDMEMPGLSLWQHSLTIGSNDLPVRQERGPSTWRCQV